MPCFQCKTFPNSPRICSGCKFAVYCDENCKKLDWKTHKPFCVESIRHPDEFTRAKSALNAIVDNVHLLSTISAIAYHNLISLTTGSDAKKQFVGVSILSYSCPANLTLNAQFLPVTPLNDMLFDQKNINIIIRYQSDIPSIENMQIRASMEMLRVIFDYKSIVNSSTNCQSFPINVKIHDGSITITTLAS